MSDVLTTLVSFEKPVEATPAVLRSLEELYMESLLAVWAEQGMENITPAEKTTPCRLYSARAEGRACLLVMPAPAAGYLHMQSLSAEQYDLMERGFAEADVYYAALVLTEQNLVLYGPVAVRREGRWLTDDVDTDQILPRERREHMGGEYSALLGDLFAFKQMEVLIPRLVQEGGVCAPVLRGLDGEARRNKQYFYLSAIPTSPCWRGLVEICGEGVERRLQLLYTVFCPSQADVPFSELELISRPAEQEVFGIVELMGPTGYRLWAESSEAVAYGDGLPLGRRYRWNLFLVAESCQNNVHEFRITEGAAFEFMKENYREEHGEEPPADFAFTLSTAAMRALNQEDEGEYAASCMLCGVVEELREVPLPTEEFPETRCLMAVLRCIPDDEETAVCVYLSTAALGDFMPKVGDNIACTGTLRASARELLETAASWQDSAELAERTADESRASEAHGYFDACKAYSLALGTAAAAFVQAGWTVEQYETARFSRDTVPLRVRNQRGEPASVFVDTVMDGHSPQFSFAERREQLEADSRRQGRTAMFATVELTYKSAADRYAVGMTLSPEQEGVENRLVMCAEGFPRTESCLTQDGVTEKPVRPERMEEEEAARLFAEAFSAGSWQELSKWLREEMQYRSRSNGTELYGKIDYLRYMTERITQWKENGEWKNMSVATGSLLYEGERRPCMAMFHRGIPTGMLVFRDSHGSVGETVAVPSDCFPSFIAETPLRNESLPAGESPVVQTPQLFRPEHGRTALTDMPTDSDFARLVAETERFLQERGTPCAARHAEPALLPHLWFRAADGRLSYICLGRAGEPRPEMLRLLSPYSGYRAVVAAGEVVQLEPLSIPSISTP